MRKLLKIAPAFLVLAFSSLFANTQEIQDLEITQSIEQVFLDTSMQIEDRISPTDEAGNSFLKVGYGRQKDYRGLRLLIPYVKLFYVGMGIDVDYHMYKEEAMDAFFLRSVEIHRRPFVELCPKLALGKQYANRFLEMQVGFLKIPILFKDGNAIVVALRYGIDF